MKKRVADLDHLIQGLYEDNAKGILPQRQYFRLMEQYNSEQENLLQNQYSFLYHLLEQKGNELVS